MHHPSNPRPGTPLARLAIAVGLTTVAAATMTHAQSSPSAAEERPQADESATPTTADQFVDAVRRMIEGSASTEGGNGTLALQTDFCATTNELVVEILMSDAPALIVGGQFRLEFDDSLLTFVSAEPGDAPFTDEVTEDDGVGTLDYAVGVPLGGMGSMSDTVMARITFAAAEVCGTLSPAVSFRVDDPPTRLTDMMGTEYLPTTNDLPTLRVDRTAPVFTSFPANISIECIEDAAPGIPYATANGTLAVHYNDGGPQTPDNVNFAKAQVSPTNTNGATLNFSTEQLVGADPNFTWFNTYQSVVDQFGLDAVYVPPTSMGTPTPPDLIAYDNGNNSITGRVPAGPVAWAISGYAGSSSTPNDPAAQIINSILRGNSPADQADFSVSRVNIDFTGPQITVDFEGALTSDGTHHWYTVGQMHTPVANLGLNGTFFLRGTYTLDETGPDPDVDYFTGTTEIVANFPSSDVGFPLATDECTVFPFITYSDDVTTSGVVTTITRTWTATDECGNMTSADQIITVEDVTAPVFLSFPEDLTGLADAGTCGKTFTTAEIGAPDVDDNCFMGLASLTATRSDGLMLTDPFPAGLTTITWTATDTSGNADTYDQSVNVSASSAFSAMVDLEGDFLGADFTRCITFEFSRADCTETVVETFEVDFSNGIGMVSGEIACGPWTCVSARDALHTLRRVSSGGVVISGTAFEVNFTGSDNLISGDLNDDNVVDILDFGIFVGEFNTDYGSGSIDCMDAGPNADFNANGVADALFDFSFIQISFFVFGDMPCCGGAPDASGPVAGLRDRLLGNRQLGLHRVSIGDLRRAGMADLRVADLNRDGWIDAEDMAAFIGGARP